MVVTMMSECTKCLIRLAPLEDNNSNSDNVVLHGWACGLHAYFCTLLYPSGDADTSLNFPDACREVAGHCSFVVLVIKVSCETLYYLHRESGHAYDIFTS